jgi:hypothetical protein
MKLRFSLSAFFLIIGTCFGGFANAQLWEYIVTSEHGNRYLIDPLSVKREGSEVSYVQLTNYAEPMESGRHQLRSIVQYKSNQCIENKFAITHLIGYEQENAKGSIVIVEMDNRKRWLEVTPGKIAHIIHQEMCNYK